MKLAGITRIRNESGIIKDTLDHVANFVDGIVVYDDCSTDNTVEICKAHPNVVCVIEGKEWADKPVERNLAEGNLRQEAYKKAVELGYDWVYLFDADEFIELEDIDFKANGYYFRLFDFYITEEDKDKTYKERKWMGREYRDIKMLFKVEDALRFFQREPYTSYKDYEFGGYVKHYGKAISVKDWEDTCDYYINNRGGELLPKFTEKWKDRKGKAIHNKSDFGGELIKWEERQEKGIKLID